MTPAGETPGAGHIVQVPAATDARPRCQSVLKALRFYTKRWQHWTQMRGARVNQDAGLARSTSRPCPRYLLKIRKAKAAAAHREWDRWFRYHYAWSSWLPDKFQRVGACETGFGRKPGNFQWDSGTYISAFGIYRPAYAQFAAIIGVPQWEVRHTPRDQYEVAKAIQARFSWSAWGCGGA